MVHGCLSLRMVDRMRRPRSDVATRMSAGMEPSGMRSSAANRP